MARPRSELHTKLKTITPVVYFQPPTSDKRQYPCIMYELEAIDVKYADNGWYRDTNRYAVTYIDRDPDTPTPSLIAKLPMCAFNRFFTAENLNHFVFVLYF